MGEAGQADPFSVVYGEGIWMGVRVVRRGMVMMVGKKGGERGFVDAMRCVDSSFL